MKLSKEDFKKKVNEMEIDDEKKIELLEDIEDSFEVESDNTELEEIKAKYEELKEKYKARFLDSDSKEEEEEKEEVKEVEEVDVEEI
jgi:hypothetical protein